MPQFRWLSADPIPPEYDLRRRDWILQPGDAQAQAVSPGLLADLTRAGHMFGAPERAMTIILGADDSSLRAHALRSGFAEALPSTVALNELEQRVLRVIRALDAQPSRRRHGALELDLLLRDGLVNGRRLGLHPREFGLLWRLAETPGEPVTARQLLSDVWRINFDPETNSLAVHVCRLRTKLASAGLAAIVSTTPQGAYALSAAQPTLATEPRLADKRHEFTSGPDA